VLVCWCVGVFVCLCVGQCVCKCVCILFDNKSRLNFLHPFLLNGISALSVYIT